MPSTSRLDPTCSAGSPLLTGQRSVTGRRSARSMWPTMTCAGYCDAGTPRLSSCVNLVVKMVDDVRMKRVEGLLDGVDYHQFYFQADDPTVFPTYPDGEGPYPDGGPANRLLATTETGHAVCVSTGIAMGVVHLAIEILDSPPSNVENSHDWEAIAEVSMTALIPAARIELLMQSTEPPFDGFELPRGAGPYRVRGHATGRSLDFDCVVDGVEELPREYHLLQLWPTDRLEPPTVIRADDPWANQ